jgi:hypothetical protein
MCVTSALNRVYKVLRLELCTEIEDQIDESAMSRRDCEAQWRIIYVMVAKAWVHRWERGRDRDLLDF